MQVRVREDNVERFCLLLDNCISNGRHCSLVKELEHVKTLSTIYTFSSLPTAIKVLIFAPLLSSSSTMVVIPRVTAWTNGVSSRVLSAPALFTFSNKSTIVAENIMCSRELTYSDSINICSLSNQLSNNTICA